MVQFKQYVIKKSEEYLNRKVSIETIDFILFKGFIVNNFTVQKKTNSNELDLIKNNIKTIVLVVLSHQYYISI